MSDEQGYNGWKNYETWVTALWIDNDPVTYEMAREMRDDAVADHEARTGYGTSARGSLAAMLRTWMEDSQPDMEASVWLDLLTSAFEAIDWFEIADGMLSEISADNV